MKDMKGIKGGVPNSKLIRTTDMKGITGGVPGGNKATSITAKGSPKSEGKMMKSMKKK
jgi:hypothetical protein